MQNRKLRSQLVLLQKSCIAIAIYAINSRHPPPQPYPHHPQPFRFALAVSGSAFSWAYADLPSKLSRWSICVLGNHAQAHRVGPGLTKGSQLLGPEVRLPGESDTPRGTRVCVTVGLQQSLHLKHNLTTAPKVISLGILCLNDNTLSLTLWTS